MHEQLDRRKRLLRKISENTELSIRPLLVKFVEKIKEEVNSTSDISYLMQIYGYLLDYAMIYKLTTTECFLLIATFNDYILPSLCKGGYFMAINKQFPELYKILKKQGQDGEKAAEKLTEIQSNCASMISGELSELSVIEQSTSVIKGVDSFKLSDSMLISAFNESYKLKNINFITLSKRIYLYLSGYQDAGLPERRMHITVALSLCCEGLGFAENEKNQEKIKHYTKLIDICFALYFAIHADLTTVKNPICLSGLSTRDAEDKATGLKRLQQCADLLISYALELTIEYDNLEEKGRTQLENFIVLIIERAKALYEQSIYWIRSDDVLSKEVKEQFAEKAFEKLYIFHSILQSKNLSSAVKAFSVEKEFSVFSIWQNYRKEIKTINEEVISRLKSEPIVNAVEIVSKFNQDRKILIRSIFEQSIAMIKKLPFFWTMPAFGSTALETSSLYSDLEFGMILEKKGVSIENRELINIVLQLFELYFIAFGQTPYLSKYIEGKDTCILSGLRLDDVYTALSEKHILCDTIEEILNEENVNLDQSIFFSVIQASSKIAESAQGGDKLYQDFQGKLEAMLSENEVRKQLANKIITMNGSCMQPPFSEDAVKIDSIKEALLRPLTFLMSAINLSKILGETTTLKQLEKLAALREVDPTIAGIIKLYYTFALRLRFLAHAHYGSEAGEKVYLKSPISIIEISKPFCLNPKDLEILMSFRCVAQELFNCFKEPGFFEFGGSAAVAAKRLASLSPQSFKFVIPTLNKLIDDCIRGNLWEKAAEINNLILAIDRTNKDAKIVANQTAAMIRSNVTVHNALQEDLRFFLIDEIPLPPVFKEIILSYANSNSRIPVKIEWAILYKLVMENELDQSLGNSNSMIALSSAVPLEINQGIRLMVLASRLLLLTVEEFGIADDICWSAIKSFYGQLKELFPGIMGKKVCEIYQNAVYSELAYFHKIKNDYEHPVYVWNLDSTKTGNTLLRIKQKKTREIHDLFRAEAPVLSKQSIKKQKIVGEGSYGIVYEAMYYEDISDKNKEGQKVACKELRVQDLKLKERFARDAKIMWQCNGSSNIVKLIGICTESGYFCLVMEWMSKGSLGDLLNLKLNPNENIDWPKRLKIAVGIAAGLAQLHALNIMHRDLKTSNILVDEHYVAKIVDFGSSKLKNTISMQSGTKDKCTVRYYPPEWFRLDEYEQLYAQELKVKFEQELKQELEKKLKQASLYSQERFNQLVKILVELWTFEQDSKKKLKQGVERKLEQELNQKLKQSVIDIYGQEDANLEMILGNLLRFLRELDQKLKLELEQKLMLLYSQIDVYNLGMVLWELVTGKIPFSHLLSEIKVGQYILSCGKEKIPEDCFMPFRKVIESCWEKDPAKRPKAIEVQKNLQAALIAWKEQTEEKKLNSSNSPKSLNRTLSTEGIMRSRSRELLSPLRRESGGISQSISTKGDLVKRLTVDGSENPSGNQGNITLRKRSTNSNILLVNNSNHKNNGNETTITAQRMSGGNSNSITAQRMSGGNSSTIATQRMSNGNGGSVQRISIGRKDTANNINYNSSPEKQSPKQRSDLEIKPTQQSSQPNAHRKLEFSFCSGEHSEIGNVTTKTSPKFSIGRKDSSSSGSGSLDEEKTSQSHIAGQVGIFPSNKNEQPQNGGTQPSLQRLASTRGKASKNNDDANKPKLQEYKGSSNTF